MQAGARVVSGSSSSNFVVVGTHQHQPISTWFFLDVLGDVPIWHPGTHDAKGEQCLRNLNNREHIWMRIEFSPFTHKVVYLVRSVMSGCLI